MHGPLAAVAGVGPLDMPKPFVLCSLSSDVHSYIGFDCGKLHVRGVYRLAISIVTIGAKRVVRPFASPR
jgi:hypothetical protein